MEDQGGSYEDWWSYEDEAAYWTEDWDYYDENYEEAYYEDQSEGWEWTDESTVEDISDLGSIPEGERYQEAFNIAKEANKTLSEARQAVAKVRAARGYFDPAGMKGSSKGAKGKGKPKGKGKKGSRSSYGPCFTCGSMNHGYMQCPDRFSAKGGSPSGSPSSKGKTKGKGKGKGKFGGKPRVNYGMAYFVDIEKYKGIETEYVNVMSLQEDNAAYSMHSLKVIIDTGATESVCGVTMARMMDSYEAPEYHGVLDDRPNFRFGNGHSQQATSRLDLKTKALGWVSFYLLDGQAEMTPALLGGRELWARNAVVAYCGKYFAHETPDEKWWTNQLIRLRGRHVAIDVSEDPIPLREALDKLDPQTPNEDVDGNDGHDGDGGSGGRRARRPGEARRSEQGVHGLVRHHAARSGNGLGNEPQDEGAEEEQQEEPEDSPMDDDGHGPQDYHDAPRDGDRGDRDGGNGGNETGIRSPPYDAEMEIPRPSGYKRNRSSASGDPWTGTYRPPGFCACRVPSCRAIGCRHMQLKPGWQNGGDVDDHEDLEKDTEFPPGGKYMRSQLTVVVVETESQNAPPSDMIHEDEPNPEPSESHMTDSRGEHAGDDVDETGDAGSGSVLMVMPMMESDHGESGRRVDDRLQALAQRLRKLKNEIRDQWPNPAFRHPRWIPARRDGHAMDLIRAAGRNPISSQHGHRARDADFV